MYKRNVPGCPLYNKNNLFSRLMLVVTYLQLA